MIGSVKVADQYPVELLTRGLIHHLLVPATAQEVAVGGEEKVQT